MLATPGDLPVGPDWVYEVEWDGLRVLAEVADGRLRLVTPEDQDVTPCFPELGALTHLVPDVVLDGTIVLLTAGVPDAAALEARLRGAPAGPLATLMLSDILRLYGVPLLDRTQDERRATLERLDLRVDRRGGALARSTPTGRRCGRRRRSAGSRACWPSAATRPTGQARTRRGCGSPTATAAGA